jgi:rRNA-processing protein FCF1
MPKVILDTNALLMPFETSINLDLELRRLLGDVQVIVPGPMVGELKRSSSKYKKVALALARKYEIVDSKYRGDAAIIDIATSTGAPVVTNDRELRRKLKDKGIRTIYLRSYTHLEMD